MLKITYSNKFYLKLLDFIDYIKKYYKNIYFDTGLVNEEQIIYGYIDKTDKLYDDVLNKIEDTINNGYFGNIYETKDNYEKSKLVLKVRSYSIVVDIYKLGNDILIQDIFIN